jgi:signal transduction histidine kinase
VFALALIIFSYLASEPPATRTDLLVLIPASGVVSFVAAAFGYWAVRRWRIQRARAEILAEHLQQMREENRRRVSFLNAISHDLRTPLNGITLQTHVMELALQHQDTETLEKAVAEVRASSGLTAEILDALLQYARVDVDPNIFAPVQIKEVLQQTAEPFRAAAEDKALAFTIDLDHQGDLELKTDREKFQRILANLLDNAVKFTQHGSVTIRAKKVGGCADAPTDGKFPLPSLTQAPAPRIVVEVADTGEGIAPENREKVFREFFQAHNPGRDARLGLGLGLVIARRLAHQLGGELECESEPRQGSVFRLTFPETPPPDLDE